jgi:hypothetical protein
MVGRGVGVESIKPVTHTHRGSDEMLFCDPGDLCDEILSVSAVNVGNVLTN